MNTTITSWAWKKTGERQDATEANIPRVRIPGDGSYTLGALKPVQVNWGIGMIAMPFYLHAAGLEAGLLFFVLSMLLAWDAANVMHHLAQRLQETPKSSGSAVGWDKLQDCKGFCYRSFMSGWTEFNLSFSFS